MKTGFFRLDFMEDMVYDRKGMRQKLSEILKFAACHFRQKRINGEVERC